MTIKKSKELVQNVEIEEITDEEKKKRSQLNLEGYSWKEEIVTYGGIKQTWLIVSSEKRQKSDLDKLEKKLRQEKEKAKKLLKEIQKDPLFFTDSFFVEKPERIETMLFLMSFCLLVYNLGQRELRNCLKRAKVGVRNQVGKLTLRPTLRWIFQSFQGIHYVILNEVKQIVNLTEERRFILLPASCQRYYL